LDLFIERGHGGRDRGQLTLKAITPETKHLKLPLLIVAAP